MLSPTSALQHASDQAVAPTLRAAAEYALHGDLRYLSHHDELRLLARALARAGWPVCFSRGFNPIPRLSLPLPRSVGMTSYCQWALVELHEQRTAPELFDSRAEALPPDCTLKQVLAPAARQTPHALGVEYAVDLDPPDALAVGSRLGRLMTAEELVVQRHGKHWPEAQALDIRPWIETLTLDGPVLRMRLRCTQQRTARPSEILAELGLAIDAYAHRVRRARVIWDMELAGGGILPAAPEGTQIGTAEEATHR